MQIAAGEATWPVMGSFRWTKQYFAMASTPLGVRDIVTGHQLWMTTRVASTGAVYLAVIAAFGGVEGGVDGRRLPCGDRGLRRRRLLLGRAGASGRRPRRPRVLGAAGGLRGDQGLGRGLYPDLPVRDPAHVSLVRDVLPCLPPAAALGLVGVRDAAPARCRPLPRG